MSTENPSIASLIDAASASADTKIVSLLDSDFDDSPEISVPSPGAPSGNVAPAAPGTPAAAEADPRDAEIERLLGVPGAELRAALQDIMETRIASNFLQTHPDYYPCSQNWDAMQTFLNEAGMPISAANLQTAFETLSRAGALIDDSGAPAPAVVRAEPPRPRPVTRPAAPAKPISTGLPDRAGADHLAALDDQAELERKLAALPLDQARQLIQQRMYDLRTRGQ